MSRLLPLISLFAALLLSAPVFSAEKKRKEDSLPVPPPQPVAQEISVRRGEPIEIQLKIYGKTYTNLKYLIRTGPASGKLSEPRVVTQEGSVVTYKPPVSLAIKHDRFTYAVQNAAGVSAAVEVGLTIVDDAAQLIAPDEIVFAPLLAGGAALKEMEISNIGGSIAEGEVTAAAPFRIEGPVAYKLAAGARQKFLVFFEPKSGGSFRGELRYSSQPDRVTTLRGTGEAALEVVPAELRLQTGSGTTARLGRLEITNNTDREQALTLTAGARLHAPASLTLPVGGKESIAVSADEGDPRGLDEVLTIAGAGLEVRVPVRAAAVGAVLKVDQDVLRFPPVRRGRPAAVSLKLENLGGTEGFWKWEIEPPFQTESASIRLPPHEQREIKITIAAEEVGSFRGWIRFAGEQQTRETRLEAEVLDSSGNPAPATPRATRPGNPAPASATEAETAAAAASVAKATDEQISTMLYLRDHVKVTNVTTDHATIEWPSSLTNAKTCRVELRNLRMDDQGQMRTDWLPPPVATVRLNGERFIAELRALRPGFPHTVRIVPVLDNGEAADPLFLTQFQTLPPREPPIRITRFRAGIFAMIVLAAGAFAWRRIKQNREE